MAESHSIRNPKEDCPWMIMIHGGENGIQYLTEEDHQDILNDLSMDRKVAVLRDKRVFNLVSGFQNIVRNPSYINPEVVRREKIKNALWEEYSKLKKAGTFDSKFENGGYSFKQWLMEKKHAQDKK